MSRRTAETVITADARQFTAELRAVTAKAKAFAAELDAANAQITGSTEAAAAKTAAAHEKMIASAKKSNEAFAKWGTVASAAVIGASVDMAVKVEDAGAAIAKASGTASDAGKRIEDAFRKIPGTVEYSGAKIGDAFATIAGEMKTIEGRALTTSQAVKVMTAALDLADATGTDLKSTTENLGKVMLTFGLHSNEAGKAADVLFNASKATGESLETFTTTLDKARGRLGALAPSVTETAALMAELAKQGVAGRLTMGSLAGVFGTLLSKAKPVEQTLQDLGAHVFNSKGQFVGLRSVIEQLHPAFGRLNQESQLQAARMLFGEKAAKQMLEVIRQGPSAFDQWTKRVGETGTAAAGAAKEHKTLAGQAKAARAELENVAAKVGEKLVPILKTLAEALRDSINWLDKHKTAAKVLAVVITTVLGAAVIDFAVGKVAKFVGGIQTMIAGLKLLAVRMGLTAAAVTAADDTIIADNEAVGASYLDLIPGVAIIAGVALAGYELGKHWDEVMEGMETATADAANFIISELNELLKDYNDTLGKLTGKIHLIHEVKTAKQQEEQNWGKLSGGGTEAEAEAEGTSRETGGKKAWLEKLWVQAGGSKSTANMAAAVAMAESGGVVKAENRNTDGSVDRGLWQINSVHGKQSTTNTLANARAAVEISEGGKNWAPWVTFKKGLEKPFLTHASAMEKHTAALEGKGTLPGHEKGTKGKAEGPDFAAIDKWAEEHVGKFRESTGKNTGPELDALQKEFHTRAAAWCAEFATTAAMMGGANKAVRTASVATIREWAEQGSHGYKKGVSHTPHVGDLMMFGNEHVGFVQSVHGNKVTTIEGNTSGGKVEVEHRTAGEGTYATPIYRSGGAGSVIREGAQKRVEEGIEAGIKRAEHLWLTVAQRVGLHAHVEAAGMDRGEATAYGSYAADVGTYLQGAQAKWARQKLDLSKPGDAALQKARDEAPIFAAQSQRKYYQREVKALQAEAREWGKIRDSYKKFARHATGPGAKKEALKKAAEFDGKVKQAQKEAAELGGSIAATEAAEAEAREILGGLPGEVSEADLGAVQKANAHLDLEAAAGVITPQQAKERKEANDKAALEGKFGPLTETGTLEVKAELKALQDNTNATQDNTSALKEATKALNEFNAAGKNLSEVEAASLAKSLADVISGQIGGRPGVYTAAGAAGGAARY